MECRETLQALRQGDQDAWRRVYDAYAQRVWRVTASLMSSIPADVADVVQEVFLAAATSARAFDPQRGSLWMWLLGITRRQVALHYRKEARRARLQRARQWWEHLDGAGLEWLTGEGAAPPDVLAAEELKVLVQTALMALPPDYHALLTRRYLDDVSADEIARETGSTAAGVRAKLYRARQAFRRSFLKITGHGGPVSED